MSTNSTGHLRESSTQPPPPVVWRAGRFTLHFPSPTIVMGIINVTPDSFSDGGRFVSVDAAVDHALKLVDQGAGILDVGGESSRPGAAPVAAAEEQRRVLPVIERLAHQVPVPISIDTLKPEVARVALEAGASIVNDVGANRSVPGPMWEVVSRSGAGYVCMHMQGSPQTMQDQPVYTDVVTDVLDFFTNRLAGLAQAGVAPEHVVLDVGLGFGKTSDHNLQLLAALRRFTRLGRPLLVGASRKSFIGKLLGAEMDLRLPGSLACACWAALNGAHLIRAHDVAETVQGMRMLEAIAGQQPSWFGNS